jgi:hypothetical protein
VRARAWIVRRVHHHRIEITGPPPAVEAAATELVRLGARRVPLRSDCLLVLTTRESVGAWAALSARHRAVCFAVEAFEAYHDEYVRLHAAAGVTTVMACRPVIDEGCGSVHDEDGEPLEPELLRAAAETIGVRRLNVEVGTLSSGLDTALTVARALGRFSVAASASLWEDPGPEALEAVRELGVVALWVAGCSRSVTTEEQEFRHALRLTRAALQAGLSEWADRPGAAFWEEWLSALLGQASWTIEAARDTMLQPPCALVTLNHEHYATAEERLERDAMALLTTCIETLALFDAELAPDRL